MREEKKRYDDGHRSILDKYKVKALEDIGFQWAKKKGEELWEKRFQELVEFRAKHGCDPGTKVSEFSCAIIPTLNPFYSCRT